MRSGLSFGGGFGPGARSGNRPGVGPGAGHGAGLAAAPALAWLGLFLLVPALLLVKISLAQPVLGAPPYSALLEWNGAAPRLVLHADAYRLVLTDPAYRDAALSALRLAGGATALCLALGYPMALAIARAHPARQMLLLGLVTAPLWTSFLIRVYAWMTLLQGQGLINSALLALGITDAPLTLLHTPGAVLAGLVYGYLPFMVLPLTAVLSRMDPALPAAAADLGAGPWTVLWRVTVPLSAPGVWAGCALVGVPALGEFVVPDLLGGPGTQMLGKTLWEEFFVNRDWPTAAALACVLVVVAVLPALWLERRAARRGAAL